MFIVRDLQAYEADADLLLSIGVFDGVHLGHRTVLERLMAQRRPGALVGAMTFDRHPEEYFHPGRGPKAITTVDEKINLLAGCGLDMLFMLAFDARIQQITADTFLADVLLQRLRTRALIVGQDWRFGRDRAGDVALAQAVLTSAGCVFETAPLMEIRGERVSSSRVRALVEARRFDEADEMLGSPYVLRGLVVAGDGRGQLLGFPTANLRVEPSKLLPPAGIYGAVAHYDGRDFACVVSIGDRPTFDGGANVVEAYLLDFSRSVYGEPLSLRHFRYVRDQKRYDGPAALVAQMHRDVAAVRSLSRQPTA